MELIKIPKVTQLKNGKVYVTIYLNKKRIRLYNGFSLGININPNTYEVEKRKEIAKLLSYQIAQALEDGMMPSKSTKSIPIKGQYSDLECLKKALKSKKQKGYSNAHFKTLSYVFKQLEDEMRKDNKLSQELIFRILSNYDNATSYNTIRAYILNLCNEATRFGLSKTAFSGISRRKPKEELHKPIKNLSALLGEIRSYNSNLYVCCLLTYGCLLRPHREIRELKWSDFTDDLSFIRLSGKRNKSGRNRIVPVPSYIKGLLIKQSGHLNIFSGKSEPYSKDYFKGLWSRFKKHSNFLEEHHTLYSFRHSGAINIYNRTGSIEKLKIAMGHSNVMVSLTYLRGLDVPQLKEEDMPELNFS